MQLTAAQKGKLATTLRWTKEHKSKMDIFFRDTIQKSKPHKKRIAHITTKCWSKNVLTGGGLMVFLTAPEKSAGHPIKALLSFRLLDPACAWKMLPSIKVLTRASRDTGKTWLNKALNRTRDREVSLPKAYKDSAMQHSFLGATGLWLCEVCQCWKGTRSPYPRNDVTRPWSSRGGSQFERLAFLSPDR